MYNIIRKFSMMLRSVELSITFMNDLGTFF